MSEIISNNYEQNSIVPSSDKKELLAQLYFFRSVLGWLYIQKDNCNNAISEHTNNIDKLKTDYANYETKLYAQLNNDEKNLQAKRTEKEARIDDYKKSLTRNKEIRDVVSIIVMVILGLLTGGIGGYRLEMYVFGALNEVPEYVFLVIVGIVFAVVAFFLLFFINTCIVHPIANTFAKKDEKRIECYKNSNKRYLRLCTEERKIADVISQKHKQIKKLLDDKWRSTEKQIAVENNFISNTIGKFNSTKQNIANAFMNFIIEIDWGMTDNIIYMLASGRANTMQEALNNADLKIRHEQTMQVLNTIDITMKQGFSYIGKQMDSMITLINGIDRKLGGIQNSLDKINKDMNTGVNRIENSILFAATYIGYTIKKSSNDIVKYIGTNFT